MEKDYIENRDKVVYITVEKIKSLIEGNINE
jgi:hypothetical protein